MIATMQVCGIDPGLETTGYAVLDLCGEKIRILDAGVCRTDVHAPLPERLYQLSTDIWEVLTQWKPSAIGVEQLYAHYKHPRTAILMGHARGVILAAAARREATIHSFNPTQVKQYLTGNGQASKAQMQRAVAIACGLSKPPEPNDVADALAVALCCAHHNRTVDLTARAW